MTKKIFLILLALVLAVSIGIVGCTAPAEEEEEEEEEPEIITLKFGTVAPETHLVSQAVLSWQNKITEETDGVVQWENYFGTLLSIQDCYAEIQAGLVDIGGIGANYEPVGFQIQKTWAIFFIGAQSPEVCLQVSMDLRETFPEIDGEFSEVKLVGDGLGSSSYNLMTTNVPIRSLSDLTGLQIKTYGAQTEVINELGASGVEMSMYDVYPSLETGILDGLIGPSETLKSLNLVDLVRYHTTLNLASGITLCYGMNLDTWNSLPEEIQQVFEDNTQFLSNETMRLFDEDTQASFTLGAEQGIEFIELAPEELEYVYDLCREIAIETAEMLDAQGLPGTEIYEEAQRLIAEYQE